MDKRIIILYLDGNCPVQGEGTIDGEPFYFRARGNHWSLSIGGKDLYLSPEWKHIELYSDVPFAAGWMSEEEALVLLEKAANLYLYERNS